MTLARRVPRRGAAMAMAVVALAVVAVVSTAVTWQLVTSRRVLDQRLYRLQAEWLARAGVELAVGRLLGDPTAYGGETVELIPDGVVRVRVYADPVSADVLHVTSEAHFPVGAPNVVVRSSHRALRGVRHESQVHIEVHGRTGTAAGRRP